MSSSMNSRVLLVFVIALALSVLSFAQKDTGSIVGTVKDQTGALVANAKVTVTDVERGPALTTTTNDAGEYVAGPLRVGCYTVMVQHPGFKQAVSVPVNLDVQQRIAINVTLQVGQISEEVEVTGAAPLLETETSELGQVVDHKRVANLPLNGRNFAQLVLLTAGTAPSEPGARDEGGYGFSANGARSLQNNFLIDGVDNNSNLPDLLNETNYVIQPSVEALEEFKVQTNAYSAEFGRGNGAIINATIKSGTNQFHGSVYEFLRNEKFDGKNFFDDPATPIAPYKQNQFGFTFGGPIARNRTFFFVDYEGLRIRQAQTLTSTVPTDAQRSGDFSDQLDLTQQTGTDCLGHPTFVWIRNTPRRITASSVSATKISPALSPAPSTAQAGMAAASSAVSRTMRIAASRQVGRTCFATTSPTNSASAIIASTPNVIRSILTRSANSSSITPGASPAFRTCLGMAASPN